MAARKAVGTAFRQAHSGGRGGVRRCLRHCWSAALVGAAGAGGARPADSVLLLALAVLGYHRRFIMGDLLPGPLGLTVCGLLLAALYAWATPNVMPERLPGLRGHLTVIALYVLFIAFIVIDRPVISTPNDPFVAHFPLVSLRPCSSRSSSRLSRDFPLSSWALDGRIYLFHWWVISPVCGLPLYFAAFVLALRSRMGPLAGGRRIQRSENLERRLIVEPPSLHQERPGRLHAFVYCLLLGIRSNDPRRCRSPLTIRTSRSPAASISGASGLILVWLRSCCSPASWKGGWFRSSCR